MTLIHNGISSARLMMLTMSAWYCPADDDYSSGGGGYCSCEDCTADTCYAEESSGSSNGYDYSGDYSSSSDSSDSSDSSSDDDDDE